MKSFNLLRDDLIDFDYQSGDLLIFSDPDEEDPEQCPGPGIILAIKDECQETEKEWSWIVLWWDTGPDQWFPGDCQLNVTVERPEE